MTILGRYQVRVGVGSARFIKKDGSRSKHRENVLLYFVFDTVASRSLSTHLSYDEALYEARGRNNEQRS